MTDKEKLEKVRAEIESRKKLVIDNISKLGNSESERLGLFDRKELYTDLLFFIDSMEKKPKECMYSKDNYTDEDRKVLCEGCEEECKYVSNIPPVFDEGYWERLGEKPVSEDLEATLEEKKFKISDTCLIQYASREAGIKAHAEEYSFNIDSELFQQLTPEQQKLWRKEIEQAVLSGGYCGLELAKDKRYDEEPVSDDLEQAIDTYLATYFGGEKEKQDWPFLKKMAIYFANWQKSKDAKLIINAKDDGYRLGLATMKQQLMAKAVDAQCFGFQGDALFSFKLPAKDYLVGSKVRVIIIKED